MIIRKAAERASHQPNPDYFTGEVWMSPVVAPEPPSRVAALRVSFMPGARTAWHTHPYGQTLLFLDGAGRVQTRGGKVALVQAGDVVSFAPGEEHWHGAAPDCAMTHLAMQEAENGVTATWLEKVSDEDYLGPTG